MSSTGLHPPALQTFCPRGAANQNNVVLKKEHGLTGTNWTSFQTEDDINGNVFSSTHLLFKPSAHEGQPIRTKLSLKGAQVNGS